jgi:hypothetical protein
MLIVLHIPDWLGIAVITIHAITIAAAIMTIGPPIPVTTSEGRAEASISATSGRSAIIPADEAALQGVQSIVEGLLFFDHVCLAVASPCGG